MLIDTHCHLDFKDFDPDRDEVIDRARAAGVERIVNVGSSLEGSRRAVELAAGYDLIYASVGIHPHDAAVVNDKVIADLKALAADGKVVAVGEVGLDYHGLLRQPAGRQELPRSDAAGRTGQIAAFKKFIALALDLDLPLIFHSREAGEDMLAILKKESKAGLRGVIHCFSEDEYFLKTCLDLGLFVSFTCNLTFKKAEALRKVAACVPPERLLLETDAPFLAPQSFRGKRNEPAYLKYLVTEWSNILGLSEGDIGRITTHNASRLFKMGVAESAKIAYQIRDSLYLNITNRCTNRCDFCIRNQTPFVKGHNLKLDKEPSVEEILDAVGDPKRYREIVFCGYGEPTARLDVLKAVARKVKEGGGRIRVVTNGHGDLINKRSIIDELTGLVDRMSVSLNAETEEKYGRLCRPEYGPAAYHHILDFIKRSAASGIETEVTCLDLPGIDVNRCARIANALGARFRMRSYGVVG